MSAEQGTQRFLVRLAVCKLFNRWKFLKQVLCKDNQVLDIYYAVAPGHWADVAKWFVCAPVVNDDAHVGSIYDSVAVKVNGGDDRHLPKIASAKATGPFGIEVEDRTIIGNLRIGFLKPTVDCWAKIL